jgi:hypothetical protein
MSRTSFEVQVLTDKNWVIAQLHEDEGKAKAFADSLLKTGNHAAVRVVRDYQRADGSHTETVVEEKKGELRGGGDLSLAPITEAPPCTGLDDFLAAPARATISRLLRKYLDEVVITPTELLHSAPELKRFGDKDRLLFSSIDRVSSLQAKAMGEDVKARRDFLDKSWDQLMARAKAAQAKKLATPKTPRELLDAVAKQPEAERSYVTGALLVQRLLETRNWLGKIDLVLQWAEADGGPELMALMDGVVADTTSSAQLIQDLLGFQPNLGSALCHLTDLAEGKAEPAKFAPPSFAGLNALLASGKLAQSRQTLFGRVIRELSGTNPLSRNEPSKEYEMFHKVVHRLVSVGGVIGGAASAEAILQRGARVLNSGGASLSAGEALNMLLSALADGCHRVQFLLALSESKLGQELGAADVLAAKVEGANHIDAWVPVRVAPRDRMHALFVTNKALRETKALAEPLRKQLCALTDEVLAKYLVDEGVIDKIDKPDDPLALRAIRLVKFCGSGVLIEGKSLNIAKLRVIEHLKQKSFEEKFLASVPDPAQAEKHLREFHKLLVECGFG